MARLPGMTPFEDDTPNPRKRLEQSKTLYDPSGGIRQLPRLQPKAAPVDTYARPPAEAPAGAGLARLADALGSLNSALQAFGSVNQKNAEQQARAQAARDAMTLPREELINRMGDQGRDYAYRQQLGSLQGSPAAAEFMRSLEEAYNNPEVFNKENGDINAFVAGRVQEFIKNNPQFQSNEAFAIQFQQTLTPYLERFKTGHMETRKQLRTDRAEATFADYAYTELDRMMQEGKTPQAAMDQLRSQFRDNKDFLGLDPARQDKAIIRAIDRLADKGNPDFIKGLAGAQRKAFDNPDMDIGPLAGRADFDPILRKAETAKIKGMSGYEAELYKRVNEAIENGTYHQNDDLKKEVGKARENRLLSPELEANFEARSRRVYEQKKALAIKEQEEQALAARVESFNTGVDTQVDNAVRSGRLAELPDKIKYLSPNGEEKEVSKEEAGRKAAVRFEEAINQQVQAGKMTREQGFEQMVQFYENNNSLTNQRWKDQLNRISGLSNAVNLTSQGVPQNLADSFQLARTLKKRNPLMYEEHTNRQTRALVEAAELALEYGYANDEKGALLHAANAYQNSSKDPDLIRRRAQEIEQKAKTAVPRAISDFGKVWNSGYAQIEITEMAKYFAQTMAPDEAITRATEAFKRTHVKVNDMAVKVMDRNMPEWYASEMEKYMKHYVDLVKDDDITSVSDLGFIRHQGQLFIVNRKTLELAGGRHPDARGVINLRVLEEFRTKRLADEQKKLVKQQNDEAQDRYTPWFTFRPDTYIGPFVSGSDKDADQKVKRRAQEVYQERQRRTSDDWRSGQRDRPLPTP